MRTALALLLALTALSGCLVEGDLDASDLKGGVVLDSHHGTAHATAVTIRSFTADVSELAASFALDAVAGHGAAFGNTSHAHDATHTASTMPLAWALDFGDGNRTNGTSAPAVANHTYGGAGTYNATLTVTSGNATATKTIPVNATVAQAPTQAAQQLTGSVSCLPTMQLNGEIAGDEQAFVVEPDQTRLLLTFSYPEEFGVEDLDILVTDAAGDAVESAESGPEPPLEFLAPAAGEWTVVVAGYSCAGEASYTIDLVFG